MGWTSSWEWTTPTVLRREYVKDIKPVYKVVGWTGSWLKLIDTRNDRPFVVDVMVRKFGHREYGYKDVASSSGPYDVSQAAANWLRRELAKRNMAPANDWEASWLLRCERMARRAKRLAELKPGTVLKVIEDFQCTDGSQYKVGDEFILEYVKRNKFYVRSKYGCRFRLSSWIFIERERYEDYPVAVVA